MVNKKSKTSVSTEKNKQNNGNVKGFRDYENIDNMSKPDIKGLLKNVYKDKVFTSVASVVVLFSLFVGIYIR